MSGTAQQYTTTVIGIPFSVPGLLDGLLRAATAFTAFVDYVE
jgi:hypothetical protein